MFRLLVILMIVVPAIEIWGLMLAGQWIGAWPTFALVLLTGFVGAFLAKREGIRVLNDARAELSRGRVPARSLVDAICIFAGGLLLLTPGFLTDTLGFLLVLPGSRHVLGNGLLLLLRKIIFRRRT